jgi:hypothetical protein
MDETMETPVRGQRGFMARAIGAALLNVDVYEEVEADRTATGQAAMVVGAVAIAMAIGGAKSGTATVIGGLISGFVSWLVWAAVTNFVGTRIFGGTADWGELLRTLGFAQAPNVLWVLGVVGLASPLKYILAIWTLLTGIVAIRQALDFGTGKALLTALVGVLAMMATAILVAMLVAGAVGLVAST